MPRSMLLLFCDHRKCLEMSEHGLRELIEGVKWLDDE